MNLVKFRIRLRLTQEQVAKKVGVYKQQYQEWEAGKVQPTYSNMVKLAKALECKIDDFIEDFEKEV